MKQKKFQRTVVIIICIVLILSLAVGLFAGVVFNGTEPVDDHDHDHDLAEPVPTQAPVSPAPEIDASSTDIYIYSNNWSEATNMSEAGNFSAEWYNTEAGFPASIGDFTQARVYNPISQDLAAVGVRVDEAVFGQAAQEIAEKTSIFSELGEDGQWYYIKYTVDYSLWDLPEEGLIVTFDEMRFLDKGEELTPATSTGVVGEMVGPVQKVFNEAPIAHVNMCLWLNGDITDPVLVIGNYTDRLGYVSLGVQADTEETA